MVASAAARILVPQMGGKAVMASQGTFFSSIPAPSIPMTRGRQSCSGEVCEVAGAPSMSDWPSPQN